MKKSLLRFSILAIALAMLSFAISCQKQDTEADIEVIKNLTEEYDAAINSGDLDSLVSLYTDDAVRMSPNMPALVGKDAIRSVMQSSFKKYTIDLKKTIEEVIVCDDLAFVRGTSTVTSTPKVGGEPIRHTGKWVTFNKRQPDGSWRIYRHIYNYNND